MMLAAAGLLAAGQVQAVRLFSLLAFNEATKPSTTYKASLSAAVDTFSPATGLVTCWPARA
jgi:hypothetical protein